MIVFEQAPVALSLSRSASSAARISVMSVNIPKEPRNSPSGPRSAVEDTEVQTSPPSLRLKRRSYVPGSPACASLHFGRVVVEVLLEHEIVTTRPSISSVS